MYVIGLVCTDYIAFGLNTGDGCSNSVIIIDFEVGKNWLSYKLARTKEEVAERMLKKMIRNNSSGFQ